MTAAALRLDSSAANGGMAAAHEVLERVFGYKAFRLHQAAIVETVIGGGDALALMPTGGGKSLCYQIPALVRSGVGIVVSPLIALMQDQVDALEEAGVRAAFLNSTLDRRAQDAVERDLLAGRLDLLYVAPERLVQERTLSLLARAELSLFAIDEAHCVSQWGHDFRPEYRQLRILAERFPRVPRIALTATADERTREEIASELCLEGAKRFVASFDRPNIRYTISENGGPSARDRLWRFIAREHASDSGIVYCLSRKAVEETAAWLVTKGRKALPYHAGLPADVRRQTQQRFLSEDGLVIVATIAFGMGIDKPDVRFVAHLNLPKSIEAYYQETGRAGRDGEPADAWMAYGLQDIVQLRQWIAQSEGSEAYKKVQRQKLDALVGLGEMAGCRRQALLAYFGEIRHEPCGNCDNCLEPPETIDGTELARKALSAVYRTEQRFGVAYVIDVLMGRTNERVIRNGHDRLAVFGIGKDTDEVIWRALFRQLAAAGCLQGDTEGYNTLALSELARPILRGETPFRMRAPSKESGRASRTPSKRSSPVAGLGAEAEQAVFAMLRVVRSRLSQEAKVPPYVICHDRTLVELAQKRPGSLAELQSIIGLGANKIARYGQAFLDALAPHRPASGGVGGDGGATQATLADGVSTGEEAVERVAHGSASRGPQRALPASASRLSRTVGETLALALDGLDPDEIAEARGLTVSTVHSHLAEAIEAGAVEARDCLKLDDAEIDEILAAFEDHQTLESGQLGPAHAALDGRYAYGVLRCVLAELA